MIKKIAIALVMILIAAISLQAAQILVPGIDGDCGFSKLKTMRFSHFDEESRVLPQYPPAAKAAGITGTVYVWILINKDGLVEKTCPNYEKGKPVPDKSLVIAAEAAALQWRFDKNFGLPSADGIDKLRFNYIEKRLDFNFVLDDPNEKPNIKTIEP